MANTCSTEYRVYGPKEQLDKLWKILNKLLDVNKCDLRNLVEAVGSDYRTTPCRGYITAIDQDAEEGAVVIYQDTAWCEQKDVRYLLEQKFPGIKIYYIDEELGCESYTTNDMTGEVFNENWILHEQHLGTEYCKTLEEVAKYVNEQVISYYPELSPVEPTEESIQNAIDLCDELDEDNEFYLVHLGRFED